MAINACIYDSHHRLVGCVTDSVIEHFKLEFETLKQKHFGEIVTPLLGVMEKSLVKSEDGTTADFLNCLKLITRKHRDNLPLLFVQEVSRAYHALVRYCCSQAVYDEVLEATIARFREAGLDYVSGNSYGMEQNDCMFEYRQKKVSIRMRQKQDLFRFWEKNSVVDNCATVYDGNDEYVIAVNGNVNNLADEIIKCVDEEIFDTGEDDILNGIIAIIRELLFLPEC